ncbi:acid protease [Hygrophoropsis aurantiaca]|uniref:Acid protease n=1 Tax=Hygrophoropsis aurantiaca TaxID=72124 RepID=A0ACB8AD36_9AGAM|nr:acid protease [Hygrophoropsis aurantiaca]
MYTSYLSLTLLFLLAPEAAAWPLYSSLTGRTPPIASGVGYLAKLRLPFRSAASNITGTIDIVPLFDAKYAERELQDVLKKYANVTDILKDVGLVSDPSIINPLNNAEARAGSATNLSGTSVSAEAHADVLIPLVNANPTPQAANDPLTDYISGMLDLEYFGPLNLGTPKQQLTFDIDTGSADLWILVGCDTCNNRQFESTKSQTYRDTKQLFSVTYGSGQVSGTLARDTVSVGSLTATTQYFGAVNQVSDDFNETPSDGLVGLAFGSIASSGRPTFFETLMSQGSVAAPLFSVFLERKQMHGSEICFGCYDMTKAIGPITWVPVTSKTYWAVSMDGVLVNGHPVATLLTAAIDTGTTLIYVPEIVARQVYEHIPGAQSIGNGFYSYNCSSYPTISLSFGGKAFRLSMQDFNLGRLSPGSNQCVGGILSLGNNFESSFAIIGDEFLKSWYSTYDYSHGARVGFSPSVANQ